MAKKYPHSSRRFTNIRPDEPASLTDESNLKTAVSQAVQEIDSVQGPRDPTNPGRIVYPGWVRMSTQEKIRAVVDAMDDDPTVAGTIGSLTIKFEKAVRDAYEEKHRRKR